MSQATFNLRCRGTEVERDVPSKGTKSYAKLFARHEGVKRFRQVVKLLKGVKFEVQRVSFSQVSLVY